MDKDTKAFLATLSPQERREWLRSRGLAEQDWDQFQADNAPRFGNVPLTGRPVGFPAQRGQQQMFMPNVDFAKLYAARETAFQNQLANDMSDEVERAIQRENDSRVAQSREMRRMAHEQYLEQMKIDALLKKLQLEAQVAQQAQMSKFGPGPKTISFRGGMITHG